MRRNLTLVLGVASSALAGCSSTLSLLDTLNPMNMFSSSPDEAPAPARVAAPAAAGDAPEPAHRVIDTGIGKVLATNRGMTLYTFANDMMGGMSMCAEACAASWPPLIALDDALATGQWTVVQRTDGLKQWAYGGWPLYGPADDRRPGDTHGDGRASGAWKAARP